ncbi:MAG: formate dehydrogenase accessory sulfurtransferase FdhD [Nitriliruptorales bacterium]|nr:formate dehydrogenase accessory sulfurtransferase FdhD [Nitriliruptorales bacterium]
MSDVSDRPRHGTRTRVRTHVVEEREVRQREDTVATEEPLEIRIAAAGQERSVATTMRTPGDDWDLAAGFLHSEGIVRSPSEIATIRYCADDQRYNVVTVDFRRASLPDLDGFERYGTISSACGVCGTATLDALERDGLLEVPDGSPVSSDVLTGLPPTLRRSQTVFADTGGLHAAGVFTADGDLVVLREDVGRHNALDKVLGWAFLEERLPLVGHVLVLSGRASYELVQKAVVAGIGIVAAVSAPSSLAIETAERFGVTLVGFLRGDTFNIYSRPDRIT